MFSSDFYTNNRKNLLEQTNVSLIAVTANGLLQRSADTTFPFRQDSNFWYLCGIDQPDYILVISATGDFLIAPEREDHRDLWEGRINTKKLMKLSGVSKIVPLREGIALLKSMCNKYGSIGVISPPEVYMQAHGFYTNPAKAAFAHTLQQEVPDVQCVDVRMVLARLRQVKQPCELAAIKKAISITNNALRTLRDTIHSIRSESEVHNLLTYQMLQSGASGHAYEPIVATDNNATTIHYTSNNAALKNKHLLLLDVGAAYGLYAADISRTYALKKPSPRLVEVYDAVLSVQKKLMKMIRPGLTMRQIESMTEELVGDALVGLGLIKNKTSKNIRKYYPHAVSHFLGLDVHDAADYDMPLSAGMVITVEPGIYIAAEKIGVRIEDDVVITKNGIRNLSSAISNNLLYYL